MKETLRENVNWLIFETLLPKSLQDRVSRNAILYIFYGCISTMVDWTSFYIAVSVVGMHYIPGATIGFLLSSTSNFLTNKHLNFQNSAKASKKQYGAHLLIGVSGLMLVYLFLYIFIDILGLPRMGAKILTSFLLAFYGYFAHKNITFNANRFNS